MSRLGLGFVALYFLFFGYPVLRAIWAIAPGWQPGIGELLAILVLPAVGWLVHQRWRNRLTRLVLKLTYTWLGVCFLALCVTVPWEVLNATGLLPDGVAGWLLVGTVAALSAYALANALPIVTRYETVHSPHVARPMRIVQISDVHVGSRGTGFLRRVVERVNALEADAVMITGDLIDLKQLPENSLDPIAALRAPAWFSIGNHEQYIECEAICERMRGYGVRVLRDEAVTGNEFQVIGIDDDPGRQRVEDALAAFDIPDDVFTIVLYHRPDGFEAAARAGVDLMLCGHTHAGQIAPFNHLVRRQFPRAAGRFEIDGCVLYVSPGTGTWGPVMRLGSSNEITVFDIAPEPVTARRDLGN